MGLAPSLGNGWVRFQPAPSRKVGQISTGVDNGGFLAPRKPKESKDEAEILRPTDAGPSRKAGQRYSPCHAQAPFRRGQLLAGSGHRMMASPSLWMTARRRASPPPSACVAQCMPTAGSGAVAGNDRATWAMLRMPQPIDTRLAPRRPLPTHAPRQSGSPAYGSWGQFVDHP